MTEAEPAVVAPPGLETANSGTFRSEAHVFSPGAQEYMPKPASSPADGAGDGTSPPVTAPTLHAWSPPSPPVDAGDGTYQYQYNLLLYQYNTEVPFLRHQVVELTNRLAELDRWKMQTMGLVRDLRDQHRALRRKIGDDPSAPPDQKAAEVYKSIEEAEALISTERKAPPPASPPPPPPGTPGLTPSPTAGPTSAIQDFDADTGLKVYKTKMDGVDAFRADWKVNHFSTKLRGAMGRPVVSAPFDMHDMQDIRLMITPEVQESSIGSRTRKEKEQFSKMVTDGPLFACLTLKVPNSRPVKLGYVLHVGDKTSEQYECDFSNTAIDNRGTFGKPRINWLLEVKDAAITVGVEMLPPQDTKDEEMPPAPPGLAPPAGELTDAGGV